MQRRFPDLICIGAEKAATTWLHEMLRQNPALFFVPAFKELHYFTQLHEPPIELDPRKHRAVRAEAIKRFFNANPSHPEAERLIAAAEILGRADVDDDWYGGIFAQASRGQVCAETCPTYLHLPEAGISHLLGLNPSVKLLLFVRDPVDRAWSHIRMNLARGMISDKDGLLSGNKPMRQYISHSEYRNSMTLWRRLAAPGQLNVILYDDVASAPASVLARVYSMVGLPPPDDLAAVHRHVHKGTEMDFPKALRASLLSRLAPQYEFLSGEFPEAVSKWLAGHEAILAA